MKETKRRGRPAKAAALRSDQILPAALAAFAHHGFEGANLRQIAVEAGIDVSLIAHRYGSKLELWKAVVDDLAARFLRELPEIAEHGPALHNVMEQLIDLVCDTPQLSMFLVKEVAQQGERFEYFYERLIRPVHDFFLPLIRTAPPEPMAEPIDPDFFFFSLTGSIAISVVMRPFIGRFSNAAQDESQFRRELKRTLLQNKGLGLG
ncbi:TetR/AcrR family transcriptional regulator [Acidocella aquatica]|uniref:TetR/AcrR family transcriptional regulator n=1 Tax=Acidocella aquatica TaxID=1922313 RepID=UPI0024E18EAC|nr:TetR/AcrR family transcriptional regulator [Acidocella aquatica]